MTQQAQPRDKADATAEDDKRLVAGVLLKDRKVTAEFVDRYADCLYGYILRRVGPQTEAIDDLVQEVFLAAWQSLKSFRAETALKYWLLGIARHKVEQYYRKRMCEIPLPDEIEEQPPPLVSIPRYDEQMDLASIQEKAHRILAGMPENYRLVLLWRYLESRSAREMAELTGRSEKAIERLLSRARAKFRDEWDHGG
jgi:RNA polymerase sigma-70 factor (ECF subfamily)